MLNKKLRKITSMWLLAAILIGIGSVGIPWQSVAAADPFGEMLDEYLMPDNPRDPYGLPREEFTKEDMDRVDFLLPHEDPRRELVPELDPDAGKTDRYIVKYKDGRAASFERKIAQKLSATVEIAPEIARDTGTLSVYSAGALKSTGKISIDTPAINKNERNTKVIILSEPMLPSEFTADLKALGADKDIEYIQPDFQLSLDSLGLTVVDGDTEMEAPEEEQPLPEQEETDVPAVEDSIVDGIIKEPVKAPVEPIVPKRQALVAVIDTGVDTGHEIFDGYLYGGAADTDTDSLSYAHGTHVAGIIVNTAKDTGADIKLLPIRVFDNGNAYTSDIIAAIEYAAACGAQIINCSFGSTAYNQALYEAVAGSDALFICAVGNNRRDFDAVPSYPAGYALPNIVSVASTNGDGGFSYYSNYGENSIDIAAEGRDVYSALPGNSYGVQTGTSMSAAYVTGVAASVLSAEDMGTGELKDRLLDSADRLSNLQNKVISGRRINLGNALEGITGSYLTLNPADDFDVHGYQPSESETYELYAGAGNVVQVASGGDHTLVLKEDGTVWAWGYNHYGQCGNGVASYTEKLTQVVGLTDVAFITAGLYNSLALKTDGTVWSWGANQTGGLGYGTSTMYRSTPGQVIGLSGVTAIAAGKNQYSFALKTDGTVWSWGSNSNGQLGDGTTTSRTTPVQVVGLSGVAVVVAGYNHSLAVKSNGTVWSWGSNTYGQLGDGTMTQRTTPIQVSGLSGVAAVATGGGHSLALKLDGTVWAWGYNGAGQLGDSTTTQRNTPVQVSGLSGVTTVAAGQHHSLALKTGGTVWAWGYNDYGQLGDGTMVDRSTPVQVSSLLGVTAVAAGDSHGLALKADGTVWAWGCNYHSQLGDYTTVNKNTPIQISALSGVTMIVAGDSHSLAVKAGGTVWSWGYNPFGQLGDGTTVNRSTPVQVSGLSGVTAVTAGQYHSLAVKTDGTVWAWGYNPFGQLGDGTTVNRSTPVQVNGLSGVIAVAAGQRHSLAVKADGTVWSWGYNNYGQIGDGTTTQRNTPVQVSGLSGVTAVAAGQQHNLALKTDGTVWAWGFNGSGRLGDGTTTTRTNPVQVSGLSGVIAVAAGGSHSLAVKTGGTAWTWGQNNYGQLGDGTTTMRVTPIQVTGISGVTAVAAVSDHSLAVKADGVVWAWGYNYYGQLGDGTKEQMITPVQVIGLSSVTSVVTGYQYSLARKSDNSVWGWGLNDCSQLGLPYVDRYLLPVQSQTQPGGAITPPPGGASLDITIATGQIYHIAVSAQALTAAETDILVTYDPTALQLMDFAAQTYAPVTAIGVINGTSITIISHTNGQIALKLTKTIPSGKTWSGLVTLLKFKALKSGTTNVALS